ncbi:hypothetical protein [Sphingomonas sp. Leaf34]|uniref:hypothetical protein n=1 Tax=Sphingomonas sp. Leaf34 TaxID=1736216 RepID=UPI0012E17B9C|nr:hypothetical protein [Sphingomonas sp. Leaf34]
MPRTRRTIAPFPKNGVSEKQTEAAYGASVVRDRPALVTRSTALLMRRDDAASSCSLSSPIDARIWWGTNTMSMNRSAISDA